jgi:hypothetical protein
MMYVKPVALIGPLALLLLFLPAFAQENNTQDDLQLGGSTNEEPVLEQQSEKGIYNVLLRWPQDPASQGGLQIELVFLNASAPKPTPENIPQTETNATGMSTPGASGFTDPSIIQTTLPVESYNIAIYGDDGNLLWEKKDQPGLGGRGTQRIDFEGNYTGPVTINITDIRPGWNSETATAEDMTDSVSFTTTVVPEFPFVAVILAGGVAAGIAALRLNRVQVM